MMDFVNQNLVNIILVLAALSVIALVVAVFGIVKYKNLIKIFFKRLFYRYHAHCSAFGDGAVKVEGELCEVGPGLREGGNKGVCLGGVDDNVLIDGDVIVLDLEAPIGVIGVTLDRRSL